MNKYISLDVETGLIDLQKNTADKLYVINRNGMIFTLGTRGSVIKVSRKEFGEVFNLTLDELSAVIRNRGKNTIKENPNPLMSSNAAVELVRTSAKEASVTEDDTKKAIVDPVYPNLKSTSDKNPALTDDEDTRVTRGEVSAALVDSISGNDEKDGKNKVNNLSLVISEPEATTSNVESTVALKNIKVKSVRKQLRDIRQRVEELEEQVNNLTEAVDKLIDIILKKTS